MEGDSVRSLFIHLVLASVLISGCSGAPAADTVATSVASTLVAQPTNTLLPTSTAIPTSTPIPLAEIDLASILIQPGDLPVGYTGSQIRSTLSDSFNGSPATVNQVFQLFERDGKIGGGVAVAVYEDSVSLDSVYENLGFGDKEVPGIGVKAHLSTSDLPGLSFVNVKFIRCTAVVNIQVYFYTTVYDPDSVTSYAQRLDERLAELICR